MPHTLYVYGTLRPNKGPYFEVKGQLYDLGWFPGIRLNTSNEGDEFVVCEKITVEDLGPVDRYEGYDVKNPEGSLYIRKPYLDGWIYEYNSQRLDPLTKIAGGDWTTYTTTKERRENGGS